MKTLRSFVVLVLVLGILAIPSFAQEFEIDSGDMPGGMFPQLREIVYGRDGFSSNNTGSLDVGSSATREGLPLEVWRIVNGRDGFDFYASAKERPAVVVNGMPTGLWGVISSRDGFDVYGTDTLVEGSTELSAAKPAAMPAALWQIISGRDGFDAGFTGTCAVC